MSASITVDVSEVVKKIDPAQLERALKSALGDAADEIQYEAQRYPAAPKESYQWTYTLKRSWTVQRGQSALQRIIGNNTAYAPYVHDPQEQAWMHRGRWQTTADIVRKKKKDVQAIIERALTRWAR